MSYSTEVLSDNPSLYWKLNESSGTLADDSSSNNRDGTLSATGITYSQSGAVLGSTALLFDGSAGALQTAASFDLSAAPACTVEFWLMVTAWNDTDDLAAEFSVNYNSNSGAFIIDPCSAGTAFGIAMHCASGTNSADYTRPTTGVFHHYAFIFRPNINVGALTGYLDGNPWTPLSTVTTGTTDATFGNYVMYFMCRAASSLFLNGTLDEVAVYPTELSAGRVAAHYAAAQQADAPQVLSMQSHVFGHNMW